MLIIDDADKWVSSTAPEEIDYRAHYLFTSALQPLLAASFHLVVAVQDHWQALPAYDNLAKRLTETIEIPEFTGRAVPALREIIAWRAVDLDDESQSGLEELLDGER